MKSIRERLVLYFVIIIFVAVIILEFLLIYQVRQNYYLNLENSLTNQLNVSVNLYEKYFSDTTLYENVLNNADTFWKQTTAQVQIIDKKYTILMDSTGNIPKGSNDSEDIKKALSGKKGVWFGQVPGSHENALAVSMPLKSNGEIVGALRFISSLKLVDSEIYNISITFINIGLLVIVISAVVSYLFAKSLTTPLKHVTRTAEKMAHGQYQVKCKKFHDDEVGRLSDTLNIMASEIIERENLKNQFISSVSHELRTPLTAIKGWAITLKAGETSSEEMFDGLDIIEKECDRLTEMVEELLDFSRFAAGKITLKQEKVDVVGLINEVKTEMTPRAARDNIQFKVSTNGTLCIISDKNRLRQVLINLLDNAMKFTCSGGIVSLESYSVNNTLHIIITDTGCGIPAEELPKVKQRFYKGQNAKSRNGLGLSICDEIVTLMNGALDIHSEVDVGTKVYITLPYEECDSV